MRKKSFLPYLGIYLGIALVYFYPPRTLIEHGKNNIIYEKYVEIKNKKKLDKENNKKLEFYKEVLYNFDVDLRTFYREENSKLGFMESIYEKELKEEFTSALKKNRLDYYLEEKAYEHFQNLYEIYSNKKYHHLFEQDFTKLQMYLTEYENIILNGVSLKKFTEIDHKINYLLYKNVEKFGYYEILYKIHIRSELLQKMYDFKINLGENMDRETYKLLLSRFMTIKNDEKKKNISLIMEKTKEVFTLKKYQNFQDIVIFYEYLSEKKDSYFSEYSLFLKENIKKFMMNERGNYNGGQLALFKFFCVEDPDFGKEIVEYQIENNFFNSYLVSGVINSYVQALLLKNQPKKALELYERYPVINAYHSIEELKKMNDQLIDSEVIYHAEFILKYTKMCICNAMKDDNGAKKMLQEEFESMSHLYNLELKDNYGYQVYTDDAHISKMKNALGLYIKSSFFTNDELLATIEKYADFFEYDTVFEHDVELGKQAEEYAQYQLQLHTSVYILLKNRGIPVPEKLYTQTRSLLNHYSFREKHTSLSSELGILDSLHQSIKK